MFAASLLEKEQLLFGAGIHSDVKDDTDAGRVSRDALSRASHNLMLQELEGLKKVYCQVCETHPFGSAKAVSDLIVLHEQTCFEATENRQLVKNLRQKNASLNAEVDALKVSCCCCCPSLDPTLLPFFFRCWLPLASIHLIMCFSVRYLQGYIESGKVEDLLDEGSSKGKRRELRAELTKVQGQLEERQAEIERLKQA